MNLFSLLRSYRLHIVMALMLMLVELAVELLQPFLISKIIDDGVSAKDVSVVLKWGAVLAGCSFLAFASGITNSFYASHVSQGFGFDVRDRLYQKIQSFSFAGFNRFPASSLITRLTNDVTQIQNTIFMGLRIMMRSPLLVLGSLIMSFIVNVKLALILLSVVPIIVLFLFWAMKRAGVLFRYVQDKLDGVNNVMQENLTGMRIIKAFLRSSHEVLRFTRSSEELRDWTTKALRFTEVTLPIVLLLMNASIVGVLWFGSTEVGVGNASIGELVAVVNYAMRMTAALSMFTMIMMTLSRAKASTRRIAEVLESPPDPVELAQADSGIPAWAGKVDFDAVSFRYPGSSAAVLHNITLSVHPGETIAVMGATGAGKSSLLQLIPRLYEANSGTVLIDDVDIRTMDPEQLRRQIGYVPQQSILFTGSIKDNIGWGKEDASMEDIIEAAQRAQIHDTVMKMPNQYDTVLGQKGVNLSGGQKQRLCLARAFVRKPSILLLDDSTSALDAKTEERLMRALKQYRCTTFIITQKLSAALSADTILLLDDGRVAAIGRHNELWRKSELYRRICQSQFGEESSRYVQGVH